MFFFIYIYFISYISFVYFSSFGVFRSFFSLHFSLFYFVFHLLSIAPSSHSLYTHLSIYFLLPDVSCFVSHTLFINLPLSFSPIYFCLMFLTLHFSLLFYFHEILSSSFVLSFFRLFFFCFHFLFYEPPSNSCQSNSDFGFSLF